MKTYQNGDAVRAVVEDVYPFGIFVRLEDDTRAYIRCRELTLAGDIDPRTIVSRGSEIRAVVSKQAETDRIMELSVRNSLPDPWEDFLKQTREGDVVMGTVKNLYSDRVYVEIIPGVSGFISIADLATWSVQHPEDLLWTGDHVEAVILNINKTRKRIQLSIRQRILQLSQAQIYLEQLRRRQDEEDARRSDEHVAASDKDAETGEQNFSLSVLVVEDTPEVREPLLYWLDNHGCRTAGTDLVVHAMEIYRQDNFDVALVDLDLPVTNGLTFIRQLRSMNANMTVAVMSDPELIARSMGELQELGVAAVFPKPLDLNDILQFLERLSNGELIQLPIKVEDNGKESDVLEPYQELSDIIRSNSPITERFNQGLEKLLQESRADQAIVFHLDSVSGQISIVASHGTIPLREEHTYGLVNSPVHDVIHREVLVWENHMDTERKRRFEKLLSLLSFESCIGMPIPAGGRTEHALFIFRREAEFARYHLRSGVGMALFFSVALEDQLLNERVQALSGLFLSGQLSASFAHEIYNKVSGLDLYLRNLRSDMSRLEKNPMDKAIDVNQLHSTVESTMKLSEGLKQTVKEFRRLMEVRGGDSANLNEVINQVLLQMQPLAARAGVRMMFEPAPDLPLVAGSGLGLLQVSLNLMLNAVQHMEESKGQQRELSITCREENGLVIARFHDAGPGIHRSLWDKIFDLGFTTRPGGSGIGLFIARSLTESMGGRILVEESLIPLGTIFRLEVPCHQSAPEGT